MKTVSDIEPKHAQKWYVADIQQKLVDHAKFGANRVGYTIFLAVLQTDTNIHITFVLEGDTFS